MGFHMVRRDDPIRGDVERHARDVFAGRYGATIRRFPALMVAETGADGRIRFAAGIRRADEGFLSECYLDAPLEDALAAHAGGPVSRGAIVEVASLASASCGGAARFIRGIIDFAAASGAAWAVFTVTPRLQALLQRIGLPIVVLGPADAARIPNAADWGTYYDTGPVVAAMRRPAHLPANPPAPADPVSGPASRRAGYA